MAMIGAGMPLRHVVTRRKSFAAPPERVWSALLSIRQLPVDRSDLRAVDQGDGDRASVLDRGRRLAREDRDRHVQAAPHARRQDRRTRTSPTAGRGRSSSSSRAAQITRITVTEEADVHGRLLRFVVRTSRPRRLAHRRESSGRFSASSSKTPHPDARAPRGLTAPRLPANLRPSPTGGAVAQFGRAPESHSGGRQFDPDQLHHFIALASHSRVRRPSIRLAERDQDHRPEGSG